MSSRDSTSQHVVTPDATTSRRPVPRKPTAPKAARKPAPVAEPPIHNPAPEPFSVRQIGPRVKAWLRSAVAAGYGISLLLHATILLVLSLIIYSEMTNEESMQTSIVESDSVEAFDDVMDVRLDLPAGDLTAVDSLDNALNLEASDLANTPMISGVENSLDSLFNNEGSGGDGSGGFVAPKNARIFKKGSFTAWTVPDDPKPGQDYEIVIVVRLPERVRKYRATDLAGQVIGTDGYRQGIPSAEYRRGRVYLPMKDQTAQLIVPVPGGASRVQDKIEIRSKTLNEKQTLHIEF